MPNKRCVRVREGGEALQTIAIDRGCFSCALGGTDERTLFIAAAEWGSPKNMIGATRTGQILSAAAPSPHAGWP